jgi:hypothetical protein
MVAGGGIYYDISVGGFYYFIGGGRIYYYIVGGVVFFVIAGGGISSFCFSFDSSFNEDCLNVDCLFVIRLVTY